MPSLLLVDDEHDILVSLQDLISREMPDVDVRACSDPEAALAAAEARVPDVILSDFRMPVMDGLAFLAEVQRRHGNIPSILLTAFDERNAAMQAARRGIVRRFYMKPPDPEEVLQGLRELLFPGELQIEDG